MKKCCYLLLFLSLISLLLSACNTAEIFLNNADTTVLWKIDDYVDLSSEQRKNFSPILKEKIKWVYQNKFPEISDFMGQIQEKAGDGLEQKELDELFIHFESLRESLMLSLVPEISGFLVTLSNEQVSYMESVMLEENKTREEDLQLSIEDRHSRRFETLLNLIDDWFGSISSEQKAKIEQWQVEWEAASPEPWFVHLQRRRRTQKSFLALMRTQPSQQQLTLWLNQWFQGWKHSANPKLYAAHQARAELRKKRILQIVNIMTQEQIKHLHQQIQSYRDLLIKYSKP